MRKINMNYKRKSYGARLVALSMALMLCVTSCGKKPEKAPELLDPVSTNEAYRPVSKEMLVRNHKEWFCSSNGLLLFL